MQKDDAHEERTITYQPWYGLGRTEFRTTTIEDWLDGDSVDDEPANGERFNFVREIASRWRHLDWGAVDQDQADRNNHLVSQNTPGLVVGRYPVPAVLQPDFPELLVLTKFWEDARRHLILYTEIEWAKPERAVTRGSVQDSKSDPG